MLEISRIGQVIKRLNVADAVGHDQVVLLRRSGHRAERPDHRGHEKWQRGDPGGLRGARALPQGNPGHGCGTDVEGGVGGGRSGIRGVSKLVRCIFPLMWAEITLETSATKVQVEIP